MDLDGFVKLSNQQIAEAQAGADIATKLTQAEINWQAANKAALQNLSLLMNIQWDAQAHHRLQRLTIQKLQKVKELQQHQGQIVRWTGEFLPLVSGVSSWSQVRDAWIAFAGLRGQVPVSVIAEAYRLPVDDQVFALSSWKHFNPVTNTIDPVPGVNVLNSDVGSLWLWAASKTYHPIVGSKAWEYIANFMTKVNKGMIEAATAKQAQLDLAKKEAQEFLDKDFERLKVGPR